MKTPSNFTSHPYSSIFRKSEYETVASNIMIILKRTGNIFRKLSFDEYKKERLKDGNWSDSEKGYFDEVISYCDSPEKANTFCKDWERE